MAEYTEFKNIINEQINELVEVFKQYFEQIVQLRIIPAIKDLYKKNYINDIPESIMDKTNINLSMITSEWFKEKFKQISEEDGNQEDIDNVVIADADNGITISFGVDCGRYGYHKSNTIKVSKRGDVRTSLAEIIEGGDIDAQLKRAIENVIKG